MVLCVDATLWSNKLGENGLSALEDNFPGTGYGGPLLQPSYIPERKINLEEKRRLCVLQNRMALTDF